MNAILNVMSISAVITAVGLALVTPAALEDHLGSQLIVVAWACLVAASIAIAQLWRSK